MSDKAKMILSVVLGVLGAVLLFCLIVCVSCSITGLNFGEQVCDWFGNNKAVIDAGKGLAKAIPNVPLA